MPAEGPRTSMPAPAACAMAGRDIDMRERDERDRDDVELICAPRDQPVRTVSFRFAMLLHLPGRKKCPTTGFRWSSDVASSQGFLTARLLSVYKRRPGGGSGHVGILVRPTRVVVHGMPD
jgi:hypothetical protein